MGLTIPEQALNIVVFPAPLGPIKPVMVPTAAWRLTSSTATAPPKCTDTSWTSRPTAGGSRPGAGVWWTAVLVPVTANAGLAALVSVRKYIWSHRSRKHIQLYA